MRKLQSLRNKRKWDVLSESQGILHVLHNPCVCVGLLSHVRLFPTPWTAALQAPVHGILQAWILEWVVISFSRGSSSLTKWPNQCLLHWQVDSLILSHLGITTNIKYVTHETLFSCHAYWCLCWPREDKSHTDELSGCLSSNYGQTLFISLWIM